MNDDTDLLRRYAVEGSEDAFAELVRRHVDLVYGAALRRTGDTHRAADVAQEVFVTLARDARKLSRHTVLAAWLHTATRNAALNLMISEQRRRTRERQALEIDLAPSGDSRLQWERLRPVLDAAIDELPETDRVAVVLRFLERRPFAVIGATLQVSEDAARMRTDRALDKLRTMLSRRGITSTSAALAALVTSQPLVSAPANLAALLATESLATAAATTGGITLFASLMNTTTLATAVCSSLLAFGAGSYFGLTRNLDTPVPPQIETPRHSQQIAALRQGNLSLKAEVARLNADVARLTTANSQLTAPRVASSAASVGGVPKEISDLQKATLNNLRQIAAARDQFMLEHGQPPTSVDELVGETKYIRRLIPVDGENYSGLSLLPDQQLVVVTNRGGTVTYDSGPAPAPKATPVSSPEKQRLEELGRRVQVAANKAVDAYRIVHGKMPPNEHALLPYFSSPQEGADFVEFLEAQKAARR